MPTHPKGARCPLSSTGLKRTRAYRIPVLLGHALERAANQHNGRITDVVAASADKFSALEGTKACCRGSIEAKLNNVAGLLRGEGVTWPS